MNFTRRFALAAVAFSLMLGAASLVRAEDEHTLYLDTKDGRVTIKLRPDLADRKSTRLNSSH